ncbi:pancreatic triacylglycerol lipase-like [Venturia canescens]|uniref:pancreatic triacylglycerol lipase-like n=1 Tax=Venturia canescens TaxID=32260 RepID=UPI001C9CF9CB|nr:pancreatic triacylglycerol lipase-like [Venturia canescens]
MSMGYHIFGICSALIGASSFNLPRDSPYIIHRNKTSISYKWEWIPPNIEISKEMSASQGNQSEKLEALERTDGQIEKLAQDHISFYLYTKKNPLNPQVLTINSLQSLRNSYFEGGKSTVFITHGWINNANVASCTAVRDAYLAGSETVNVIVVDWSSFSVSLYHWSVEKVETVGTQIARMIDYLRVNANLRLSMTTLVGHSLGAHVMGVAGRKANGVINQIFGLDPARPMFEDSNNKIRLSSNAARNVQVIHTNGNQCGLLEPLGHADFYPNGGTSQPGCAVFDLLSNGACSHGRAFYYFAESLNSRVGFKSVRCRRGENVYEGQCRGKVGIMGGRSNLIPYVGLFYLKTGDVSPYAYKLRFKKQ